MNPAANILIVEDSETQALQLAGCWKKRLGSDPRFLRRIPRWRNLNRESAGTDDRRLPPSGHSRRTSYAQSTE